MRGYRGRPTSVAVIAGTAAVAVAGLASMHSHSVAAPAATSGAPTKCYPPKYTSSGQLILPENFRHWVYVGSPLTPNALNGGKANFPEFHNVYMEPCAFAQYMKTNVFPEGTVFFKELQLTLPAQFPDGSRVEPSGRGFFPGPYNGADVTVKDTKRYAASGGWGYYNFNHHEPKAPTATLKATTECGYCHAANAKKDEVWTQFYPQLDK